MPELNRLLMMKLGPPQQNQQDQNEGANDYYHWLHKVFSENSGLTEPAQPGEVVGAWETPSTSKGCQTQSPPHHGPGCDTTTATKATSTILRFTEQRPWYEEDTAPHTNISNAHNVWRAVSSVVLLTTGLKIVPTMMDITPEEEMLLVDKG